MLCLPKYEKGRTDVLGLLAMLFSQDLGPDEKIESLRDDFGMMVSIDFEGEVRDMCNFSEDVLNKGIKQGVKQGIEQGHEGKEVELVRKFVRELGMALGEAMDLASVPQERRQRVAEAL